MLRELSVLLAAVFAVFSAPLPGQSAWQRLSSKSGDLPAPFPGKQQTASLVADLDGDGISDFVITERTATPSAVWYRRTKVGWSRYLVDNTHLTIEAGGAAWDIDGDGDLDIVFGGDSRSNEIWWWENPAPRFDPNVPWTRRIIKNTGGRKHHDQLVADFDGDGNKELISWNQGGRKLLLYRLPADPRNSGPWTASTIFTWPEGEMEGLAICDVNADGKTDLVGGGRWFEHISGDTFRDHVIDASVPFSRAACGQLSEGGWAEVVFVVGDGIGRLRWYRHAGDDWVAEDLLGHDVNHGHSLALGDVDGDNHLDIYCAEMGKWTNSALVPDNPEARTWIFFGDGKGGFTKAEISKGFGTHEGRLADLDGDGRLDILAKPYNWDTPRMDVLLYRGNVR